MKTILMLLLTVAGAQAQAGGVAWGYSQQNLVYCYPADSNGVIRGALPVNDTYCLRVYGGQWGRGQDGHTRCYPRGNPAPRYPIDASWCVN